MQESYIYCTAVSQSTTGKELSNDDLDLEEMSSSVDFNDNEVNINEETDDDDYLKLQVYSLHTEQLIGKCKVVTYDLCFKMSQYAYLWNKLKILVCLLPSSGF